MSLPDLYISRPGVAFPEQRLDNEDILRLVKASYRGSESDWPALESAILKVFGACKSQYRFLEPNHAARVADYACAAARHCLEVNQTDLSEVDLVICGGIARQYFEPATAMEVAAKLGLKRTHAFDVTAACVGHLEAIQTAAGYLAIHDHYRTALVCTSELFGPHLSYDLQSVKDLYRKSAGLTLGNGAACVLLRKQPWLRGGVKLLRMETYTVPGHWHLCQAPVDGPFESSSIEMMRLGRLIPPWLSACLTKSGWTPRDVDHYVFHQPSELMTRRIIEDIGGDGDHGVYSHSRYGNTASASVGISFNQLLLEQEPKAGAKMVLASAAAGFSCVALLGEWTYAPEAATTLPA
jgi:3-oxoacyl-[acyl-carrier-protein] synthase III